MVVVMAPEAGETEIDGVVERVRGGRRRRLRQPRRVPDDRRAGRRRRPLGHAEPARHAGGQRRGRITAPYKLVSREHHRERSVIRVAGVPIGPDTLTVIAGPVRGRDGRADAGVRADGRAAGASLLRGGAYKPRSSPYAFQGLGEAGLKILAEVRQETGLRS